MSSWNLTHKFRFYHCVFWINCHGHFRWFGCSNTQRHMDRCEECYLQKCILLLFNSPFKKTEQQLLARLICILCDKIDVLITCVKNNQHLGSLLMILSAWRRKLVLRNLWLVVAFVSQCGSFKTKSLTLLWYSFTATTKKKTHWPTSFSSKFFFFRTGCIFILSSRGHFWILCRRGSTFLRVIRWKIKSEQMGCEESEQSKCFSKKSDWANSSLNNSFIGCACSASRKFVIFFFFSNLKSSTVSWPAGLGGGAKNSQHSSIEERVGVHQAAWLHLHNSIWPSECLHAAASSAGRCSKRAAGCTLSTARCAALRCRHAVMPCSHVQSLSSPL